MTELRFCQACGKELPTSARLKTPPVEFVVCPSCGAAVAVVPLDDHDTSGERARNALETVTVSGRSLAPGSDLAEIVRRKLGRRPLSPWMFVVVAVVLLAIAGMIYGSSRSGSVASASAAPRASTQADPPTQVVSAFYDAIGKHDYATAWGLLSPGFQRGNSFARFKEGYASTQSVRATVSAVPGAPQKVNTALDATDLVNGATVHSHLDGMWILAWSATDHRWLLDQGIFKRTSTGAPPTVR